MGEERERTDVSFHIPIICRKEDLVGIEEAGWIVENAVAKNRRMSEEWCSGINAEYMGQSAPVRYRHINQLFIIWYNYD